MEEISEFASCVDIWQRHTKEQPVPGVRQAARDALGALNHYNQGGLDHEDIQYHMIRLAAAAGREWSKHKREDDDQ